MSEAVKRSEQCGHYFVVVEIKGSWRKRIRKTQMENLVLYRVILVLQVSVHYETSPKSHGHTQANVFNVPHLCHAAALDFVTFFFLLLNTYL